ncbi:MAG: YbjQ family protein [FCB group bacterium]|nr:YbjQ family protein [FCB group bacterium]
MILVNTDSIPGKRIHTLGMVKGFFVQSKHVGRDIMSVFKSLVGGELKAYSEMLNESRERATARMVAEAEKLGADAVVNIRYASSQVMAGAAEILVYGTAVTILDDDA